MSESIAQAQAEGLILQFPETLQPSPQVNYDQAYNMLVRFADMSTRMPFVWRYIDKPPEGALFVLYVPTHSPFPSDGIRYQEQEQKRNIPLGNGQVEIEMMEVKFGFVPGVDQLAWRVRRRFRLTKGGHPALVLVHYPRGQAAPINQSIAAVPVRNYPLRMFPTEPALYVIGPKQGERVFPQGSGSHSGLASPGMGGGSHPMVMPGSMEAQRAMLAAQNGNMEQLERRREREQQAQLMRERERMDRERQGGGRERSGSMGGGGRPAPPVDDEDSADEVDHISTRTLALNRYKRNHELMNQVFHHAAFGNKSLKESPSPLSIFKQDELDENVKALEAEVAALKSRTRTVE